MPQQFTKAGIVFSPGDQILVKQGGAENLPYVARIDKITKNAKEGGYDLKITWYYRPEDVGRRVSTGVPILILSSLPLVAQFCVCLNSVLTIRVY